MAKKLTITEVLAQKEKLKSRELKKETLYIPSLDAEITIIEPTRAQLLELKDMEDGEGNDYLVYQCITDPNLKENRQQLMTEFGCAEPHEIVQKLFGIQEIPEIVEAILGLSGISQKGAGVKVVESVKN